MNGRQTFGNGTAGTALVVIGSRRTTFGRIDSTENYKPVLYCSVEKDAQGRAIDNENCVFVLVTGTSARRSLECSLIALLSGRGSPFAGPAGPGVVCGLHITRHR